MLHAFFCDEASTEQGKLHIRGIFSELVAAGFPARHERLVLCGIIEWPHGETGRRHFSVDLLDPADESVFTVEGHTDLSPTPAGRAPARTHLVLPLQNVVFPVPGRYRTLFRIDNQESAGPDLYLGDSREPG